MHQPFASHEPAIFRERRQHFAWGFSMSDPIRAMLERAKTLAIVGLSSKATRASNGVAAYMQAHGYRVIPVNPHETLVLGEKAYPRLESIPESVDIVVVFRRSEHVPKIVESAIRLGAKALWMQEGVQHEAAARRARAAGLEVVQDRCILKEHANRFLAGA